MGQCHQPLLLHLLTPREVAEAAGALAPPPLEFQYFKELPMLVV